MLTQLTNYLRLFVLVKLVI